MRVVISAGGTGGHIYPALAIVDQIKKREPNSEFLYIGTHNRMEKDIVPEKGIPFKTIEIYGFHRKQIFKNFKTIKCFLKSIKEVKQMMKEFKPDIVIGVGGYVTGPVIYAAKKLGIPTLIHEQNSVPGKANLFLSKYADRIAVSFKTTIKHFPEYKTIFTGNPCSESAKNSKQADRTKYGLNKNKKLVYIVMGSLGSSKMSDLLVKTMNLFQNKEYEILFVTGKDTYETVSKNKFPKNVFVVPYVNNQTEMMRNVDLMVTRCGASTLSEIIALRIPSILIPSPYVPDNHQYKNAIDFIKQDAALLIEEKDLKGDLLVRTIDTLIHDQNRIQEIKTNLGTLDVPSSASMIYETIKEMVK